MSCELSIIIPTYNERTNIEPLIAAISLALPAVKFEIIFVDDNSPDGTAEFIKHISQNNESIRCIKRLHRRGLSSATLEGILSSAATYVAVMDADMQHDETLLQNMVATLQADEADIVIGSRYIQGGSTGQLSPVRVLISRFANWLASTVTRTSISDPMSGFFMLKRLHFEPCLEKLSGKGFKVLLDILTSKPANTRIRELPYTMRSRMSGDSKLDTMVIWEYYMLLIDKTIGRFIPTRFIMFTTVGLSGVGVHYLTLLLIHQKMQVTFVVAQSVATFTAMTTNYIFNNIFTYRDQKLKGLKFIYGLFSFYFACSIGAVINVILADYLFSLAAPWSIAGISGAIVGAIWNYAMTATFTWRKQ